MSGSSNVWQIVIQKQFQTEYFVNDYHVIAASFAEALDYANDIVAAEKAIFRQSVAFVNMRIKQAVAVTQGTVVPIGGTGSQPVATYLPLYVTARVDFSPAVGRPGRKYLRLPVVSQGTDGQNLTSAAITSIVDNYLNPILGLGVVCKPNADIFVSGGVFAPLQMRQIRRGSKRRLQPII